MPATATDRIDGLTTSVAVKAPCVAATTAPITLSGEQTVDGIACVTGNRVLVKDQADQTQNGIWVVDTGTWTRARDFDGARDAVEGTLVVVVATSGEGSLYRLTTPDPVVFETSDITFDLSVFGDAATVSFIQAGTGAVARTAQNKMRDVVSMLDYAASGLTAYAVPLQAAIDYLNGVGGGSVLIPTGDYDIESTITLKPNVVLIGEHGASLTWTGGSSAKMFTSATSTPLVRAGVVGLALDGADASKILELFSAWHFTCTDINFQSNSVTNFVIDLRCNSSGTFNDDGNYNNVFGYFANLVQNGDCGTFLRLQGNAVTPGQVVTLNTFSSLNANGCNVRGIDFAEWCDNNVFNGMVRIAAIGASSVGVEFGTAAPTSQRGIYSTTFQHLAVDTFGSVGGRTGLKLNLCKGIKVDYYYNDPIAEVSDLVVSQYCDSYYIHKVIVSKNYEQTLTRGHFFCIGGSVTEKYSLYTTSFTLRGADEASIVCADTFSSEAAGTTCAGITLANLTEAATWTLVSYYGLNVTNVSKGAGNTITNQIGVNVGDLTSATNNFAFRHEVTAAVNKFGFYGEGTAANLFNGGVCVRVGAAAATDGFNYVSGDAGAPSGTPTTVIAKNYPMYYDTTNNEFYIYNLESAAWKKVALT